MIPVRPETASAHVTVYKQHLPNETFPRCIARRGVRLRRVFGKLDGRNDRIAHHE